jgi:hypothetical protein
MGRDGDNERVTDEGGRANSAGGSTRLAEEFAMRAELLPARVPARGHVMVAGGALVAGVTFLVALQALQLSGETDPLSAPLSQYAFARDGWLFDVSVLTLAFGLAVLVSALVRGRCIPGRSAACGLLSLCSLALVAVVLFPEHDASGEVRTAGCIHWAAAMFAFGGLSVVPALVGRHGISATCSRLTSLARGMCAGTGPCFVLVATTDVLHYDTPLPVPALWFGLAERVLVALELTMAGVLTAWAWRGCACSPAGCGRPSAEIRRSVPVDVPEPSRPVCGPYGPALPARPSRTRRDMP